MEHAHDHNDDRGSGHPLSHLVRGLTGRDMCGLGTNFLEQPLGSYRTICAVPTPTGHRRHTGHSTHTQTLQIPYAADTAAATASATAAPTAANAAAAVAAAAAAAPPLLLLLLVATPLESPPVRPWIACDPRGFNSPEARTQAELCMMAGASSPPLVHTSKSAPFMRAGSWVREQVILWLTWFYVVVVECGLYLVVCVTDVL